MGFDKLIDFVINFIADFLPVFVVKAWQKSVVLRSGKLRYKILWAFKYNPIKGPGIYLKVPFLWDPVTHDVVTTTTTTTPQTVKTKDGKSVTVQLTIKYNISDVEAYTTTIYDAEDAILDIAKGEAMRLINDTDLADCSDITSLSNDITKQLKNKVKKYGIQIEQATLTDFIETRNYRLFGVDR